MMRLVVICSFLLLSSCMETGMRDASLVEGIGIAAEAETPLNARFTQAVSNLFLSDTGPENAEATFQFSAVRTGNVRISVVSLSSRVLNVRLQCMGPARLFLDGQPQHMRAGHWVHFRVSPNAREQTFLLVGAGVKNCQISWLEGQLLRMLREPFLPVHGAGLDQQENGCGGPDVHSLDPLQAVFFSDRTLSQTCAVLTDGGQAFLADPMDALNARVEALTGAKVSRAQLQQGNPDMDLDFSKAPDLELVYVSYLMMRADFTGYLMRRMLAWHAARGAVIRIILTDSLMMDRDCALFECLAAAYPNVQIQFYKWSEPGFNGLSSAFDAAQRAHHIKVFATLSREPGRSRFIIGGRNLWDGFFFEHPLDLKAWPELRTYRENGVSGLMYHSSYVDFEIELKGEALVKAMIQHVSAFWHRDSQTQFLNLAPLAGQAASPAVRDGVARHFMSLPWADEYAQQAYFTALLDAAQNEILITTPFFYPPPMVLNALLRARARGVRVRIVVQIHSTDPAAMFTNALNAGFLRRFGADFEIYAFGSGTQMLHSKLLLIDRRLSVVSSTNWNRRSFLHDTENGIVFLDRAVTARLRQVFDSYITRSTRVRADGDGLWFEQFMSNLPEVWQYF